MNNEPYLWDKSGPVDPFISKLERCLQEKRRKVEAASRGRRPRWIGVTALLAAASAIAAITAWCLSGRQSTLDNDGGSPPIAIEVPAEGEPTRDQPTPRLPHPSDSARALDRDAATHSR